MSETLSPFIEVGLHTRFTESPKVIAWKHSPYRVRLGKFCAIAEDVTFILHADHRLDWVSPFSFDPYYYENHLFKVPHPERDSYVSKGDILIGNDVWIGYRAIILSGVHIGDGAAIGTGAVVTSDVLPYTIVGGVPARPIRKRFSDRTIARLLQEQWWHWPQEKIQAKMDYICNPPEDV